MGFENSAGLGNRNHYGPRTVEEKFGGEVATSGKTKQIEWVFSYDDLPDPANLDMEKFIPSGSIIHSASLQVVTAFAGGTSYDIGLQQKDGTEIDNDGLWDALLLANINAANEVTMAETHDGTNSGALVNDAVILADLAASYTPIAADGYLTVAATGTFTAGKARVLVSYTDPRADASGNYTAGGVKG